MYSSESIPNPPVSAPEAPFDDAKQAATEVPYQIASLQAVVNSLTVRAAEKSKPWYRQPSVIISLLALMFSLWNTYQGNRAKSHEELQKKAEESQSIALQIVNLHQELQGELVKPGLSPDQVQSEFAVFNNKKKLLLNKLLAILQDKSVPVDPVVYLTLGDEAQFDSNPGDARTYYSMALESVLLSFGDGRKPPQADQWTLDSVSKLPVLPRAGMIYRQTLTSMANSTLMSHQLPLGREFYRTALRQLDNMDDVASKTNRYNILQVWAQAEEAVGDAHSVADRVFDMERVVAEIPLVDVRRQVE